MVSKVYLSIVDKEKMKALAQATGKSSARWLLDAVESSTPKEIPQLDWKKLIEEAKEIGRRIDRQAHSLNGTGIMDEHEYRSAVNELFHLLALLRVHFIDAIEGSDSDEMRGI